MTTSATTSASTFNPATSANISKSKANRKNLLSRILIGILAGIVLLSFLMPLGYMFSTGLKSKEQMSDPNAPVLWPFSQETFTYNGEELPVYQVPIDNRTVDLSAVNKTRTATSFVDPDDPEAGVFIWEGNWRTLEPAYFPDAQWSNFKKAWDELNFPLLFRNTLINAVLGTFGFGPQDFH